MMCHAISPRDSRDLMDEHLFDLAGCREFFDALETLPLFAI